MTFFHRSLVNPLVDLKFSEKKVNLGVIKSVLPTFNRLNVYWI